MICTNSSSALSNHRSFNRASFTAVLLSRSLDMLASGGRGAQAAPPAPPAGTASPAAPGSIRRGDTVLGPPAQPDAGADRRPPVRPSVPLPSAAAGPSPGAQTAATDHQLPPAADSAPWSGGPAGAGGQGQLRPLSAPGRACARTHGHTDARGASGLLTAGPRRALSGETRILKNPKNIN